MKSKWSAMVLAIVVALCGVGCHSHEETRTHKVTLEGPEKKTEIKVETKDKK